MDRFDTTHTDDRGVGACEAKIGRSGKDAGGPHLSLTAIRQQLAALRREAQAHDREALAECLSLAIALSSPKRSH